MQDCLEFWNSGDFFEGKYEDYIEEIKHRRRIGIIAVRDKCDPDLYLDGISFQRIAYGKQSCKGRLGLANF